jgi:hypothetical protein
VFVDDVADPRNEVHYDLIVAGGPALVPLEELSSADKRVRLAGRGRLRPLFENALQILGEVSHLSEPG